MRKSAALSLGRGCSCDLSSGLGVGGVAAELPSPFVDASRRSSLLTGFSWRMAASHSSAGFLRCSIFSISDLLSSAAMFEIFCAVAAS